MKRRRSSIAADSLDLLLDTITNTFGGILLLSLLLVLLARNVDESTAPSEQSDPRAATERQVVLRAELERLNARRDILKQSVSAQNVVSFHGDDARSRELMQKLSPLLRMVAALRAQQVEQEALQKQLAAKIESHSAEAQELEASLSRVQTEIQVAERELEKEQLRRTQTMDLPKEEVTSKRMAVAVVKGDELFLVQSDLGLSSFRFNANHFQPTDQSSAEIILADQTILKTRTGHGIPMRAGELKPSLARLDPSDVFLTVAISRDSFGSFADLRSTCVELGLEYSILPVSKFPIAEGPTSQLPKAQ